MPLYQIEAILDGPYDQDRFLIKWEGYSDADRFFSRPGGKMKLFQLGMQSLLAFHTVGKQMSGVVSGGGCP